MIGTKKYMVLTDAQVDGLSGSLDWNNIALPSLGGRSFKDIHGQNKVHDKDFWYTVKDYEDRRINNPEHSDYGKIAIAVYQEDVAMHLPDYLGILVDNDVDWFI
jgi:hypothetical protein